MREQVAAVRHALSQNPLPADVLAAQFKRSPKVAVQAVLDALEELGMVQQDADQYRGYNLGLRYQCVEFVKCYYFERHDRPCAPVRPSTDG